MQIICYLIICADIVNTIGFCWSLIAEIKEKISFLGQGDCRILEGRCWERWKWERTDEWKESREKPSSLLKW